MAVVRKQYVGLSHVGLYELYTVYTYIYSYVFLLPPPHCGSHGDDIHIIHTGSDIEVEREREREREREVYSPHWDIHNCMTNKINITCGRLPEKANAQQAGHLVKNI